MTLRPAFVPETVHKRDALCETASGHLEGAPDRRVVQRSLADVPWYAWPLASWLARKEARALDRARGIAGTPELIHADRIVILKAWIEGTPLHLARPAEAGFYRDARRLLRALRRRGIAHNDIAKPQNWLMTPDGGAAVIDFQLASLHPRRGRWFRTLAREDLRHLLKQKRAYAPGLLTPSEIRLLDAKSLPSRVWMATGKRAYNLVTRRLLNWSDGEGTGDRLDHDGPGLRAAADAHDQIGEIALCTYPQAAKGVGLYLFAETALTPDQLRAAFPADRVELVQPVAALPRDADGRVRDDILHLIATNQLDLLDPLLAGDPDLADIVRPILNARQNFTDRYIRP